MSLIKSKEEYEPAKITIIKVVDTDKKEEIGNILEKPNQAVIADLNSLYRNDQIRVTDYLDGFRKAIHGQINEIASGVILVSTKDFEVSKQVPLVKSDKEKKQSELRNKKPAETKNKLAQK